MPTSYLPVDGHPPFGWPHGTGVVLHLDPDAVSDRRELAIAVCRFGCHPRRALRVADAMIEEGSYAARLMTPVVGSDHFVPHMAEAGILVEVETVAPEGNTDHVTHGRHSTSLPTYDRDPISALIDDVMAEQEATLSEEAGPAPRM